MANTDKQGANYNKRAKDLPELQKGDKVRFIPPRGSTKEAVKARVDKQAGMRSYEVITLKMEPNTTAIESTCKR